MRKLIAFDDDTLDKLKQLGRDRMATFQELADEAFADLLRKHGIPIDLKDALRKSAGDFEESNAKKDKIENPKDASMTTDPDPFEQGRAPRAKTFRPKPILIRTAASSMRSGRPAMKKSPARSRRTRAKAPSRQLRGAILSRSSSNRF